jgi:hypothetical protein
VNYCRLAHDPQFAGMHMAMAIIQMLPQMEVECDIKNLLFLPAGAAAVKNELRPVVS